MVEMTGSCSIGEKLFPSFHNSFVRRNSVDVQLFRSGLRAEELEGVAYRRPA
jgi:hypothetical protein